MSFEIKPRESIPKTLRRVADIELKRAHRKASRNPLKPRDTVINDVQKSIQKIRSLLFLVRPEIREKAFRHENNLLRDVTRPLDDVRSAKAFVRIIDKLADQFEDQITERTFHNIRNFLHVRHLATRKAILGDQNALDSVANVARSTRRRVRRWSKLPNQWRTIGKGFERTYGNALEGYVDVSIDPCIVKLSAWREKMAFLRYQLRYLRPVWPKRLHELIAESRRLEKLLGEYHELAALQQLLSQTKPVSESKDLEVLIALVDRRQAEFARQAILLGARFFQDKPRDFARRMKEQWKAWRRQAKRPDEPSDIVDVPA